MPGTIHLHSNKASAVPGSSASMMFATQKLWKHFACLLVRSARYYMYNSAFCAVASQVVALPLAHHCILLFVTVSHYLNRTDISSSVICNELWNKGVLASVRSWLLFFCFKLCILFRRCANSETLSLTLLGTDACACVSRLMVCVNCSFVLLVKFCLKQQIIVFIRHGFLVAFATIICYAIAWLSKVRRRV